MNRLEKIAALVAQAPKLTPEQIERLRALLPEPKREGRS